YARRVARCIHVVDPPTLSVPSLINIFLTDAETAGDYTLSLHDALPIWVRDGRRRARSVALARREVPPGAGPRPLARPEHPGGTSDRKSTRLNSSHVKISYAVFCLKKKRTDWS